MGQFSVSFARLNLWHFAMRKKPFSIVWSIKTLGSPMPLVSQLPTTSYHLVAGSF